MSDRVYLPGIAALDRLEITGPEAHHLLHVLRAKAGARFEAFDGQGVSATAIVEFTARQSLTVSIAGRTRPEPENTCHLTVAVALPKGDRTRFLVEKLTELGVRELVPLRTERSQAKERDDSFAKLGRYVIEACKQCGRNELMAIGEAVTPKEFLDGRPRIDRSLILDPSGTPVAEMTLPQAGERVAVCVGPEGGWSPGELEEFARSNLPLNRLQPHILRVETAAIAMAAILINGRT